MYYRYCNSPLLHLTLFSRGAQAAVVVYDIQCPDTFSRAQAWVKELRQQANQDIVIALAGNKADLAAKREVETEVINPLQAFFFLLLVESHKFNYG